MTRIRWDDRARREANAAYRYYLKTGGYKVAEGFAADLENRVREIESDPNISARHLYGTRVRKLKKHPYLIVFKILTANEIVGIAVAHTSREPGYWLKRTR
jgi:plasmid stabilization system protein ParE